MRKEKSVYKLGSKNGDEDAMRIANALKRNASIQKISFWGNEISDEGAIAIADMLKFNTTIQELNLEYNQIDVEVLLFFFCFFFQKSTKNFHKKSFFLRGLFHFFFQKIHVFRGIFFQNPSPPTTASFFALSFPKT